MMKILGCLYFKDILLISNCLPAALLKFFPHSERCQRWGSTVGVKIPCLYFKKQAQALGVCLQLREAHI